MSLSLDQFREASRVRKMRCSVAVILDALDAKDRAATVEALDDERVKAAGVARVLTDAGHRIDKNTVQRHRRGDCSCGKDAA